MKTVLLTGATGFLGSHLLDALLRKNYDVVVLKRTSSNTARIKDRLQDVRAYNVDERSLQHVFAEEQVDAVIHTACHYGRGGSAIPEIVDTNLVFGLQILHAAVTHKVKTFVNTDTLLPRDLNAYSLSKKQFVDWLRQMSSDIQVVNLRLEHMYGPRDDNKKLVPWFVSQLEARVPRIDLTEGVQQRDFIYIDDVVSAYLAVLRYGPELDHFEELDVGTGALTTVRSFLEAVKNGFEAKYGPVETKLAFGQIPYRNGEVMAVDIDNRRLMQLGWAPETTLAEGIRATLEGKL